MAGRNSTIIEFAQEAERRLNVVLHELRSDVGGGDARAAVDRTLFAIESFGNILGWPRVEQGAAALRAAQRTHSNAELIEAIQKFKEDLVRAAFSGSGDESPPDSTES